MQPPPSPFPSFLTPQTFSSNPLSTPSTLLPPRSSTPSVYTSSLPVCLHWGAELSEKPARWGTGAHPAVQCPIPSYPQYDAHTPQVPLSCPLRSGSKPSPVSLTLASALSEAVDLASRFQEKKEALTLALEHAATIGVTHCVRIATAKEGSLAVLAAASCTLIGRGALGLRGFGQAEGSSHSG